VIGISRDLLLGLMDDALELGQSISRFFIHTIHTGRFHHREKHGKQVGARYDELRDGVLQSFDGVLQSFDPPLMAP